MNNEQGISNNEVKTINKELNNKNSVYSTRQKSKKVLMH